MDRVLTPDEKSHKTPRKPDWEASGCHFAWKCCVCLPWWVGITYLNLFAGRLYKNNRKPSFPSMGGLAQWDREPLIRFELLWSTGAPPSLPLSLYLLLTHPVFPSRKREVREVTESPTFSVLVSLSPTFCFWWILLSVKAKFRFQSWVQAASVLMNWLTCELL